MRKFVSKLGRFDFFIHNVIAHPLMEICHVFGLTKLGNAIHDGTLPLSEEEQQG